MGDKISDYPVKTVIHNDDLLDFSNTEDSGASYTVSQKVKVSELMSHINSFSQTIYNTDGNINETRVVTSNGATTTWLGGDLIVRMDNAVDDYAFLIMNESFAEKGRYGFDQVNSSAELSLSNSSGEFFKVNNNEMFVNTDSFVITSLNKIGIGTTSPDSDTWLHIKKNENAPRYFKIHNESTGSSALSSVMVLSDTAILKLVCQGSGKLVDPGTSHLISSNSDLILNSASSGKDIYFRTQSINRMALTNTGALGIGTDTPDTDSILDLSSTTRGFLGPRMTTLQRDAISSPPFGLFICNTTTSKLNFYNGSAWEVVTSV